jgi:hypothetical protein
MMGERGGACEAGTVVARTFPRLAALGRSGSYLRLVRQLMTREGGAGGG